jgi:hypothetical protein
MFVKNTDTEIPEILVLSALPPPVPPPVLFKCLGTLSLAASSLHYNGSGEMKVGSRLKGKIVDREAFHSFSSSSFFFFYISTLYSPPAYMCRS